MLRGMTESTEWQLVLIVLYDLHVSMRQALPMAVMSEAACLQVSFVAEQHRTMIEAVENHMPETVIVVSLALTGASTVKYDHGQHNVCRHSPLLISLGCAFPSLAQPVAVHVTMISCGSHARHRC